MSKQTKRMLQDIELRRKAKELLQEHRRNYTKTELNIIAKADGVKNFMKIKKYDLAEILGIELETKTKRVYSRSVEVFNKDGTTSIFPSMTQAAKALGNFSAQIYMMVENGDARFL